MTGAVTAAAVLGAVLAIYLPHVRSATFVYQDQRYLLDGPSPVSFTAARQGRGLTRLSWAFVRTPRAAHALNLGLHLVVVGLVWVISARLVAPWMAFGIASVMALHPLTIETVAYAASRADLIAAVGVLAALACATARSAWWWLLVPICLWIAYAGKETGLIGVALLPLVLWASDERLVAEVLAWGALAAGLCLAAIAGGSIVNIGESVWLQIDALSWALIQIEAIWRLVLLSAVPVWLSVVPAIAGPGWTSLAAGLLLAGVLESAWRARSVSPMLAFGVAWCALVALPRVLVQTPLSPFNAHQWYLAMPGVACCWVALIEMAAHRYAHWREAPCPA